MINKESWRYNMMYRLITTITKRWRARVVLNEIDNNSSNRLLDLGCGDGYLVRHVEAFCIGIDKCYGTTIEGHLAMDTSRYDYITFLASLEHLEEPTAILLQCLSRLKPNGKIIITTPVFKVGKIQKVLLGNDDAHKNYLERNYFEKLDFLRIIKYKKFMFGCNQLIILEARE